MNKKAIFIFALIIIFGICFYIGFNFGRENKQNNIIKNDMIFNEVEDDGNEAMETNAKEEKTTPNTILTFKKYYTGCEHTISSSEKIPDRLINLTQEEIIKEYPSWEIQEFTSDEVIFVKELESFCGEHYYLIEEEGEVNIYEIDENENKILKERTNILCEYLPETDRISLKNGITIYGKEELNKILEDYES